MDERVISAIEEAVAALDYCAGELDNLENCMSDYAGRSGTARSAAAELRSVLPHTMGADRKAGPSSDKFLGDGARKLAEPENEPLLRGLEVFMDMWGLDAYTPPQDVEMRVREIVKAMTSAARLEAHRREG